MGVHTGTPLNRPRCRLKGDSIRANTNTEPLKKLGWFVFGYQHQSRNSARHAQARMACVKFLVSIVNLHMQTERLRKRIDRVCVCVEV